LGNGDFESGTPAIGDFDGDGNLDLAVPLSKGINIFLGNGDGTFRGGQFIDGYVSAVAAADFNGDGILDIVTDGVTVLLGNGDGTFQGGARTESLKIPGSIRGEKRHPVIQGSSLSLGDFNGDGKLDVVSGGTLYLGNGDGTFQSPITLANDTLNAMGDFNNDGKLDLVGHFLYLQGLIYLTPSSLDFGNQKVGTKSPPQPATLTNDGSSALTITSIQVTGTDSQDFSQKNDCGSSLPAGSHCSIQVVFQPQAEGARSASLTVNYQGLGSPQMVALTGVGEVATVTLAPANLKFPLQLVGTTGSAQTETLTNTGNLPVNISNISATAQFTQSNNCPSSLPIGGNCQIQVKFAPQLRGKIAGTLSVSDDAQGSPQTVALSGTGTVVKMSAKGITFGNWKVGTKSPPVPIKLTNVGKSSLIISQISIGGVDPGDFSQTNNCGSKVVGGGSCTIKVTFAPQAKGSRSAVLQVEDNDPSSPQKVALRGNGT
jgi:FG-GAP-like repeat/Abnormal spindle-like microcephaly-assoc'd, ASPM-SPD-2-Hydin